MIAKNKFFDIVMSKVAASFGVYTVSSFINAAIPFLMLPIFTQYLTSADYGIVSMFSILCSFLMPFMGLSTLSVLGREYFNQIKTDFNRYVGNVFIILLLSVIPIVLILYFFTGPIATLAEIPKNVIWLVLIFSFFSFFLNSALLIWQAQTKALQYGIFQIGQTLLNVGVSMALVVGLKWGWEGRLFAQVFAVVIFGLIGFYYLFRNGFVKFSFDKAYFKGALNYGIPLIPHSLGAIIIFMSDRFFISNMVGIEATGLYAVGYSIGSIIGFVEHSFNQAYTPWLFEKLNSNDIKIKRKIVRFTYIYFILILLLVLFLTISVPLIFRFLIDKKFEESQGFVFWIALSFAFSGMYKMVTNYIFYVKKTHILAWVTFASAMINLVLNYYLIMVYGAVGAAISSTIVSFCFFAFTWLLSNKVYKMPWALNIYSRYENSNS